jgi:hypothetical protein
MNCVQFRLILAGLALAPAIAATQQRPDFTGEWTRVDSTAERPSVASVGDGAFRSGNMGSGWGSPLTIRQQADTLTIEYRFFSAYDLQPPLRFVFALDGSESRNAINIGHAELVERSRVAWRDSALVITTVYPTPNLGDGRLTMEVRQVLALDSPTTLTVETTRAGVAGAPPTVTRTTYSKK